MSEKRPAYEPASRLLKPTGYDPSMPRPAAIVAGAALVLLRALAGGLWLVQLSTQWSTIAREADASLDGVSLSPDEIGVGLAVLLSGGIALLVGEALLAFLIYRGVNWTRVLVMGYSTISISAAFAAWWVQGQRLELSSTLLTLALDILVLLALSSREAAAYARRKERRPGDRPTAAG